jgi:hypothetical protein
MGSTSSPRREYGGTAPVGLAQPVEVGRVGPETVDQPCDELVLTQRLQQAVGGAFDADRAGALRASRCRTERARTMRWPHGDLVGQLEQPLHRSVLGAGKFLGAFRVDQVGASDGTDKQ